MKENPIMQVWNIGIAAIILLLSGIIEAGDLAYTCEVVHIYKLSENGALVTSGFEKEMTGSSFSVSRITGEIIGDVVPTLLANSTRVVNKGSLEYSFKTVADFDDQVQVLEVQEFRSGPIKPFIATSMGGAGIISGTCK
jgi:hypothetical protein